MKNNKRIDKVLDFIKEGSTVADIGCDHGYVLIKGILEDKIKRGIGVEVNEGPFRQALSNIAEYNMDDQLEIRLGSGIEPIVSGEAEVCVIGGMGGSLIVSILNQDIEKARSFSRLIMQPMNSEEQLRRFLVERDWKIVEEEILELDRLYLYIVAEKGEMKIDNEFLYEIGPVLAGSKGSGREKYIREKIAKLEYIADNLKMSRIIDESKMREIKKNIEKWRSYLEN